MIAVSSTKKNFAALGKYLVVGRDHVEEGRVAWTSARNLPTDDPQLAAKIMRATASQNVRVARPAYHLALSFDPRDVVDRATMERVADRVLAELGLKQHQAIIVAHADRAHPHVHILVNRVHPETGLVWDRWQDQPTIQRALRDEERALSLRQVPGLSERSTENESKVAHRRNEPVSDREQGTPRADRRERDDTVAIHAVRRDLETHDRVTELSRQRYTAECDVAAAEARRNQLETAFERMARSEVALDAALRRAYQDPAAAKAAFLAMAEHSGEREAARRMRENPEMFGKTTSIDSPRTLLGRSSVEGPERSAAREAASHGAELVAGRREFQRLVESQRRDAVPVVIGTLSGVRETAAAAVTAARGHLEAVRKTEKGLPSHDELESKLARALRQLSPPEFEQLKLLLSPSHLTQVHRLRRLVRDAVLGREEEQ